jgi:hypothetical protein
MSDELNAYVARQRALARERQQRSRDRRRTGRDAHVTPAVTLPGARRLMQAANAMAQGVPAYRALEDAGYNGKSAQVKEAAQALLQAELAKHAVGVATIVSSVKDSLDATTPMLTADGSIERPDWTARASGRRDGIALLDRAGELPQAQAHTGGNSITINIVRFDTPQDVAIDAQFTRVDESSA